MNSLKMAAATSTGRMLSLLATAATLLLATVANAAVPGITGGTGAPTFNLTATEGYISQPDGQMVYSWGYGCASAPGGYAPAAISPIATPGRPQPFCNTMQIPGPTLIVTAGQTVTVTLKNNLPAAAGNTSILFPGFTLSTNTGAVGLLTHEATPGGGTATYSFVATSPGTHAYYSGTQGDLQIEM